MEPKDYTVQKIEGEYATLTEVKTGGELFIALALRNVQLYAGFISAKKEKNIKISIFFQKTPIQIPKKVLQ